MQVDWATPNKANHDDEVMRAGHLLSETGLIETRQKAFHELALWNTTLYVGRTLPGFRWGAEAADEELWPTNLRTENIIESIGEAMLSKASSSPIKPTPVPHGDDWEVERAVRQLDHFIVGVWRQTKSEDASVLAFRDAFQTSIGCVRVDFNNKTKSLHVEPVFPDMVIVDNRECADRRQPVTPRVRHVLPRADVEARYGVKLGQQGKYVDHRSLGTDYVVVVEAWHLQKKRYVVACCDKLLVDKPWNQDWAPLVFFHYQDRHSGFLSVKSGVEQLIPYQLRLDELNDDIKLAQDLCCRPRLTVNANSQIDVSQWDNEAGRFLMWSGSKPEPLEWPTNLNELYQERERISQRAYSAAGMSEWFANADAPQAVRMDSSAGIRESRNMEDARHLRLWTRFQEFRLEIAKMLLRVLSISKDADAFTTRYLPRGSKAGAEDITWEAVKTLTEEDYSWTLEAVPLSQMSPAARRELIRDWSSRGLIEQDEAKRLEGHPNLELEEDLELSSIDDINRHLSILEAGKFEAPTELTNITAGVRKVSANFHRLKNKKRVKPIVLENHIKWIVKAVAIQQAAVAPPPQPMSPFAPTQGMAGTSSATAPPVYAPQMGAPVPQ